MVRVSPRLKQEAERRAKELELTVSEYVRTLIIRDTAKARDN
jgi:antitoxin component of RelBE/YafQ-DinJ toxin-antitoxin module